MVKWRKGIVDEDAELFLSRWNIYETEPGYLYLAGYRSAIQAEHISVPVATFDTQTGRGRTESGLTYQLVGPPDFRAARKTKSQDWAQDGGLADMTTLTLMFYQMLADGFDPNADASESPAQLFATPTLTGVPDDFPSMEEPIGWMLDGTWFECGLPTVRSHAAKLCGLLADLFASQLEALGVPDDQRLDALRQLVASWEDGGHIPPREFVWSVRRAAEALGWECPDSVFEARLHCWLPTSWDNDD